MKLFTFSTLALSLILSFSNSEARTNLTKELKNEFRKAKTSLLAKEKVKSALKIQKSFTKSKKNSDFHKGNSKILGNGQNDQVLNGDVNATVNDNNGNPVTANCAVKLINVNSGSELTGNVNALGQVSFASIPNAMYLAKTELLGTQTLGDLWWNDEVSPENASQINVTNGSSANLTFNLPQGNSILGNVVDLASTPIANVPVNVLTDNFDYVKTVNTDANGDYELSHLPVGDYFVLFEGSAVGLVDLWNGNTTTPTLTVTVDASGNTTGVDATLFQAGSISGNVTDINNATIPQGEVAVAVLANIEDGPIAFTMPDANGDYSIDGLPVNDYLVVCVAAEDTLYWVLQFYPNATLDLMNAQTVPVTANNDTPNINFAMEKGGKFSGTVFDEQGFPLDLNDAEITIFNESGNFVWADNEIEFQNGNYTYEFPIPVGNYFVELKDLEGFYISQFYFTQFELEDADTVEIELETETDGIDFNLSEGGTFHFTVENLISDTLGIEDNQLIFGVLIDATSDEVIEVLAVSENGNTFGGLFVGDYKLLILPASSPDYPNTEVYTKQFLGGGTSLNDPNTTTINLVAGYDSTFSSIFLDQEQGGISGSIFDDGGNPFTDEYTVAVYDDNGFIATAYLGEDDFGTVDGTYSVAGLPDGNFFARTDIEDWDDKWYDDVDEPNPIDDLQFLTAQIPASASAIQINGSIVSNIDFNVFPTSIEENTISSLPVKFTLKQNFPNPFNPSTVIGYQLTVNGKGKLAIFDVLGRKVKEFTLDQTKGSVVWNGTNELGKAVSSGVYFYTLESSTGLKQTKKMLLLK